MRGEYTRADLGTGTRGKYYEPYQSSHDIVKLTPEAAKVVQDEESVNEAPMKLIRKIEPRVLYRPFHGTGKRHPPRRAAWPAAGNHEAGSGELIRPHNPRHGADHRQK